MTGLLDDLMSFVYGGAPAPAASLMEAEGFMPSMFGGGVPSAPPMPARRPAAMPAPAGPMSLMEAEGWMPGGLPSVGAPAAMPSPAPRLTSSPFMSPDAGPDMAAMSQFLGGAPALPAPRPSAPPPMSLMEAEGFMPSMIGGPPAMPPAPLPAPSAPPPMPGPFTTTIEPVTTGALAPGAVPPGAPPADLAAPDMLANYWPISEKAMGSPVLSPAAAGGAPRHAPTPAAAPSAAPSEGADIIDMLRGFTRGAQRGGLLGGFVEAFGGVSKDAEERNMTIQALTSRGLDPQMARIAARDPELLRAVLGKMMGGSQVREKLSPGEIMVDGLGKEIARNSTRKTGDLPAGWETGPDGVMRFIPGGPADPDYMAAASGAKRAPMTATEMKAVNEAEKRVPRLMSVSKALDDARELNKKAFSGIGASTRAAIGTSGIPGAGVLSGGYDGAKATAEWERIMGPAAVEQMGIALTGASTDFEMKKYLGYLADPSLPTDMKDSIIVRLKELVDDEVKVADAQLNQIREKSYYQPGGGLSAGAKVDEGSVSHLPDGAVIRNEQGQRFRVQGGRPVPIE